MVSPGHPEVVATPRAKRVTHLWPLVSGLAVVGLTFGLGALIAVRDKGLPLPTDVVWMHDLMLFRAPILEVVSLVMNYLGGNVIASIVVPVLIIGALLLLKRPWAAGYYLVATVLTGVTVQLLKHLFGRARPDVLIVNVDFGSFPSGHVANAAAMAVILSILFPRWWTWVAGSIYTIVMMFSRTYLGAHWLSDTVGGLLLGVGVAVLVWAPLAAKLNGERKLRQGRTQGRRTPDTKARAGRATP